MSTVHKENFTYKNQNCEHKKYTRKIIAEKLQELKLDSIRYCGLPALSPVLEEYLMFNYQDLKMFLAENEFPLVFKAQKRMFKRKLGVYQEVIHHYGNLLTASIGFPLNVIWFDLCGMIQKDTIDQIYTFFQRNSLEKKGLFAITWTAARERSNHLDLYTQLQKRYNDSEFSSYKDFKRNQLPEILTKMLQEASGRKFKSVICYPYQSATKGFMQFNALTWDI